MLEAPEELESRLQYTFRDRELLRRALTHKSRAFEEKACGGEPAANNEQLEFLGDAVLGFFVSEILLSKAKARLINSDHLHEVALRLKLGSFLLLGRGEEMNGGRGKRTLLADSVEALIAAIYLDGGYQAAREFVLSQVVGDIPEFSSHPMEIMDLKGALQELAQSHKLAPPQYRVVSTAGPEHSKAFNVEVSVGQEWVAEAQGSSKKTASQLAAGILLRQLRDHFSG
jgi:ribonuclease-3